MKRVSASVMILLLAAAAAWAGPAGTGSEIRVFSDSLRIKDQSGVVEFEGQVRVYLQGAEMGCDRLVVLTSENNPAVVLSGTASGHVVIERGEDRVEAGEARFDLEKETVDLTGSPRLQRGQTSISAERILYRLDDGTASFLGPVKAVFAGEGK